MSQLSEIHKAAEAARMTDPLFAEQRRAAEALRAGFAYSGAISDQHKRSVLGGSVLTCTTYTRLWTTDGILKEDLKEREDALKSLGQDPKKLPLFSLGPHPTQMIVNVLV
jgi:hypothetical protein